MRTLDKIGLHPDHIADDAGSACRGAMNMKIAKLSMDAGDKARFEIIGKSSVKYHLRANHEVEAKRWFWALNNAIQFAKDEAREEEQRISKEADAARQAIMEHRARDSISDGKKPQGLAGGNRFGEKSLVAATTVGVSENNASRSSFQASVQGPGSVGGDEIASGYGSYEASVAANNDMAKTTTATTAIPGDVDDDEEYGDDASSHELQPTPKDAFTITAHSADLQLDILFQVSKALQSQMEAKPETTLGSPDVEQAISTYLSAVQSLKSMIGNLQRISKDRDAYWQYRLDREVDMRRMWEDSMAKVIQEQEELEGRIGESEMKRKRTKKALREALEDADSHSRPVSAGVLSPDLGAEKPAAKQDEVGELPPPKVQRRFSKSGQGIRRKSTIATMTDLSDSDSDLDEEFFDAVGAGEVPVEPMPEGPVSPPLKESSLSVTKGEQTEVEKEKSQLTVDGISSAFTGYEDPIRTRLKLDADDRPRISLWVSVTPLAVKFSSLIYSRAYSNP